MGQDKAGSLAASSRYQRAVEIFLGACEVAPERRVAFVREACADDDELLASARALLAQDETSDESIDGAAASAAALLGEEEAPLPERIGGYRVLRMLGEGGMGTVYEAEQESPRRLVALKVVRAAMATPRVCRRFEQEAEVLGRLEHPGIARIYEAGSAPMPWGTVPFLAMELVRGLPLDEHAERAGLDLRARLALLARVCDAVDHAHRQGVVHRDLKPQNVLVDDQGQPKVLDFGVAWLAEAERESRTALTLEGQMVGTLAYMSPEQVRGERMAIDARADVYGLGAIGYELLSRRLPLSLEGRPLAAAARIVADVDPPPISLYEPACAGDVDVIFAKALEKDPDRRYSSAAALAGDLRRFLAEEPIVARPPSRAYQLRKFARRHRALVGGVAIAFFALLAGTTISIWKATEASDARDTAESRTRDAQRSAYRANLSAALTALRAHNVREAAARLDDAPESLRNWEWRHLRARLDESVAQFDAGKASLSALAFDRDMRFLATGGDDGTVRLWDWTTGAPLGERTEKKRKILDVRFELDVSRLLVASVTGYPDYLPHVATLAIPSLDVLATWSSPGRGSEMRFAEGTSRIAQVVWDRGLVALDSESGRIDVECAATGRAARAVLSADGRLAGVVGDLETGFEIFDLERRTPLLHRELSGVNGLSFNADASQLIVTTSAPVARIIDLSTGNERLRLAGHEAGVLDARFSADEQSIFTASADGTLRVFEAVFGSCVRTLHGHRGSIRRLAASPDGRSIVTAGSDGMARRWEVAAGDDAVLPHPATVYPVAFSPDGRRIATGCLAKGGPGLHVWDAESGELVAAWIGAEVTSLCWSRDGTRLAVGIHNRRTLLLDAATGATLGSFAYHRWNTDSVEFDARGLELLTAGLDGKLHLANLETRRTIWSAPLGPEGPEPIYRAVFSPDGGSIVASRADGSIVVFDAASHAERAVFRGNSAAVVALTFSPDGRRLVSGARNGEILVWSFPDGALENRLQGHVNEVFALAYSPDGSRLVSGGRDRTVRIWEPESGEEIAQLGGHTSFVYDLAFSPDGRTLVSAGGDAVARLWDTRSAAQRFDARRERARVAGAVASTVDQVLAEFTEPRAAVERLRSSPFSSEREREVALQLALGRLVERVGAR